MLCRVSDEIRGALTRWIACFAEQPIFVRAAYPAVLGLPTQCQSTQFQWWGGGGALYSIHSDVGQF